MTKNEEQKGKKPSKEEELKQQVEELTNTLKRTQADYENYRKRVERDKQEQTKYASVELIKKFLPILDNFELALKHATVKDEFYTGVEMFYAQIREMLKDEGVETMEAKGLPFDPYRHEALMTIDDKEHEPNTVIEVMQQGYTLHDKVLRAAKVTISKK